MQKNNLTITVLRLLLPAIMTALLSWTAYALDDQPLIEVTSAVDTSRITIGDRLTYTITIDHVDTMRVERPGEGVNLGQFEIKDYKVHDPVHSDGRIKQQFDYVISVFDTGAFVIPPFPVAYFPTDSLSDYRLIEASPITIYVESVIQDEERQLHDVKPPIEIPYNYLALLSLIAAVVLIAVLLYVGYRLYKKRKESGYLIRAPEPARPAHEIALSALENLLAKNLLAEGMTKQFYSELSELIRYYIEGRYYVHALEETSTEILTQMKAHELEEKSFTWLHNLLQLADLVKFAKYQPTEKENQESPQWAKSFIDETKIIYEPVTTTEQEINLPEDRDEAVRKETA
jgi:hypothetical protein